MNLQRKKVKKITKRRKKNVIFFIKKRLCGWQIQTRSFNSGFSISLSLLQNDAIFFSDSAASSQVAFGGNAGGGRRISGGDAPPWLPSLQLILLPAYVACLFLWLHCHRSAGSILSHKLILDLLH